MIYRNQLDVTGRSSEIGHKAEEEFKAIVEKKYGKGVWEYRGTVSDDVQHIDCYLNISGKKYSVDVKSCKQVGHRGLVWVEFMSHSYKGWLYGQQDLVAFQRPDGKFLVVKRERLKDYAECVCMGQEYVNSKELAYHKIYTRITRDRKGVNKLDVVSMLSYDEIEDNCFGRIWG
jgi:hypothetical protein